MSRHMSRAHRGGDGGTHWISYSDMMCSLLLMFILAITLCIYHYYTLLDQVGEQQAQLEAAQITLSQKEKDLETTRVELMGKEEDLAAIQIQLDTKEQDLNAAQVKLSEREAENERLLAQIVLKEADLADQQNRIDALQLVLANQEKELSDYQAQIADILGVRTRIVQELSAQLGVSKSHLVRVFSAEMGVGPGQYLTGVRLDAAKALLARRDYPLEVVATLCGFSGANYLCKVFKKHTGQTPAAFRAQNAGAARGGAVNELESALYI